ncbi:MAG: peptidoglycan-binding domain-containing protein [Candidatus Omnitrophota bacterium]
MSKNLHNYKIFIFIFIICLVISGCKKRAQESPFKNKLPQDDSTITVISTDDISEPIIEEEVEELEVMSIEIDSSSSIAPTPKQAQIALKNAGFYKGEIDGKIGPKSKEAIINFQRDNNLAADGKVGPKTWAKLKAHLKQ